MTQIENFAGGMTVTPATATAGHTNVDTVPSIKSSPIAHSQPVWIQGQLPCTEIEDGAELEFTSRTRPRSAENTTASPMAKFWLSVATATLSTVDNMTPRKKRRTSGSYLPREYESPCERHGASLVTTKRVRTSSEPLSREKPQR